MSKKTRINRPTYATPRKRGEANYAFVSAPIAEVTGKDGMKRNVAMKGTTLRKAQHKG